MTINFDNEIEDKNLKTFVKEMKIYIGTVWKNYQGLEALDSGKLEELSKILAGFPSEGGYILLEELFERSNPPTHILSSESKRLLTQFYGIKLSN